MISCDNHEPSSHPVPAFRDAPILHPSSYSGVRASVPTRSHLNGTVPVFDLEAFMEDDTDDFAFTIIRTVECSEASVLMARADGSLRWTEAIYTRSKISKNALQKIATCYFQPVLEENIKLLKPVEQDQIAPAELVFISPSSIVEGLCF